MRRKGGQRVVQAQRNVARRRRPHGEARGAFADGHAERRAHGRRVRRIDGAGELRTGGFEHAAARILVHGEQLRAQERPHLQAAHQLQLGTRSEPAEACGIGAGHQVEGHEAIITGNTPVAHCQRAGGGVIETEATFQCHARPAQPGVVQPHGACIERGVRDGLQHGGVRRRAAGIEAVVRHGRARGQPQRRGEGGAHHGVAATGKGVRPMARSSSAITSSVDASVMNIRWM